MIFKHLSRHLVTRLPWLLSRTRGLRYARAAHVRAFAAQAAAFLLRQVAATADAAAPAPASAEPVEGLADMETDGANDAAAGAPAQQAPSAAAADADAGAVSASALRKAVRALLAEHALQPSYERTDGAGLLLAETVLGVSHGLHSRVGVVLGLVFMEDILTPGDLHAAGPAAQGRRIM